ncbi:magnesium transporter CorA family protein [Gordonia sp. NB41Y]|uniref:magnesium transporter CorA family protein n=1 Tax=Gordonia sp. NB41Y TaxID=875808 RepID=UPI0002BE5558|nr:magnesium transporter CorA family protein [Gordonia sp. NB41Y]WLP92697.1 magnesium transporter CorA family protein [Gordonia sp. NB41Y]
MSDAAGTGHREVVRGQIWRHGKPVEGFRLDEISEHLDAPDTLIWADLDCPDHGTLTALATELDLDPFAIQDTIAAAERVKTVVYGHYTFMTVYAVIPRPPKDPGVTDPGARDGGTENSDVDLTALGVDRHSPFARRAKSFTLQRISIFLMSNALITVRLAPGFDIQEVVDRWNDVGGEQYGIGALLHGVLDVVVDGHFDAVQRLDADIEELEELLFDESTGNRPLQRRTYDLRKDLVLLRRVVVPMREVIAAIQRRRFENHAPAELDPHFSDLYDHALRAAEWTESLRDMITTVFETNLALNDARLNTVMKKLTGWAAIIAVPTAITGFYGQNVNFPLFGTTIGYLVSTVLIVVVVGLLYVQFRRRDWL